MRTERSAWMFCLFFLAVPAWSQQATSPGTQSPQNTSPIDALTRDLQAESVISQAVAVAGGVKALTAIADYTASATATYQQDQHEVQTTVTIMARGLHKLRIDSYLPGGVRSQATTLGKTTVKTESGTVTPARGQTAKNPGNLALPSLHLRSALTNPSFSLSYMGIVTLNGQSAHFIRVTFGPPHQEDLMSIRSSPWRTTDFYIDASTFQILMT